MRGLLQYAWRSILPVALGIAPACAKPSSEAGPCTLPTRMRLEAGERINLDPQGQALPTVVRLYQTKEIVRVEEADFADIWERPSETLGPDLLQVQQFTLFPGQAEVAEVSLGPDAHYVIGVAIFRRPTGSEWRSIIPLPSSSKLCTAYGKGGAPSPAITFRFDNYRVESKSFLLTAGGDNDLPTDVAPERSKQRGKKD